MHLLCEVYVNYRREFFEDPISDVVLNFFNRFFNNNQLKVFLTESIKLIFAMNLNLTNFSTNFCALGFTFMTAAHISLNLKTHIMLHSDWSITMSIYPLLHVLSTWSGQTTRKEQKLRKNLYFQNWFKKWVF